MRITTSTVLRLMFLVLWTGAAPVAIAHHLQVDPSCASPSGSSPGNMGTKPPGGMVGDVWKTWNAGWNFGCALSAVRDHPEGDGVVVDFERGSIVWSQGQNMVVGAFVTPDGITPAGVTVRWKITDRFHYDKFTVRWTKDGGGTFSHEGVAALDNGTAGTDRLDINEFSRGRYRIVVEGCDSGGFAQKDKCRPGFSLPVYVDYKMPDYAHKIDGAPLGTAFDVASARAARHDIMLVAAQSKCAYSLDGYDYSGNGGEFDVVTLAKLIMLQETPQGRIGPCAGKTHEVLRDEINRGLLNATKKSSVEVGTNQDWTVYALAAAAAAAGVGAVLGLVLGLVFPVIGALLGAGVGALIGAIGGALGGTILCAHDGDYDMTLRGLMPIMYTYRSSLDAGTYNHVLHDLLTERGGADKVRLKLDMCGISISETENHILMTESSRYLTNQLLLQEAEEQHVHDPQSPELAAARQKYDNDINGMEAWWLQRLKDLLNNDFHEYNARAYARLSTMAVRNMAEYADNGRAGGRVRQAAIAVLDYLAAKEAVASNNMRRASPFRRRDTNWHYTPLYGNNSDEFTWYFLPLTGNTRLFNQTRYGRGDWASPDGVEFASVGTYEVPDTILDLFLNKPGFVQTVRGEGLELYAGTSAFLISGGGIWTEDRYTHIVYDGIDLPRTSLPGFMKNLFGDDTSGFAFPTTLMPVFEGVDRADFIRIDGSADDAKRGNTCVTAGFACGMNPVVPTSLLRRIHRQDRPCAHPVAAKFQAKFDALHGEQGPLGCPTGDSHKPIEGGGLAQDFERGQMMWSPKSNTSADHFLQTAYVNFSGDIVIEWGDTDPFHYDFFIVRWDKDGQNVGQHDVQSDDANASPRNGGWTIPTSGSGRYRIVVEGCDGSFLGSSKCRQGWSNPIFLNLPLDNACAKVEGDWTFVNASEDCGGHYDSDGRGYYAAIHSLPCPSSQCKDAAGGSNTYGFFEAARPTRAGFDGFRKSILDGNPGRVWSWAAENEYQTSDGRHVFFNPHAGLGNMGVLRIEGQGQPGDRTDIDAFKLARGTLIDADGKGCVLVKNPNMRQALVLVVDGPRAGPPRTIALTPGLSCGTLPP